MSLQRRTPLKRGGQLRRTRLKPVSDKRRAADNAEGGYRDAVIAARTRANYCEAESTIPETRCAGRLDPHHIDKQGQGGPRADPDNLIMICRSHHDWIHAHTTAARERGLLR